MNERKLDRREFLKAAGIATTAVVASRVADDLHLPQRKETPRPDFPYKALEKHRPESGYLEPKNLDSVWRIERDESEGLSFFEASQLAARFGKIRESLPDVEIPASEEAAQLILAEYNNFFVENDIVKDITYPSTIEFKLLAPGRHSGVLGSCNCNDRITFNMRQINPVSPWYNRSDWLWTVVHESSHLQQGQEVCQQYGNMLGPSTMLEKTAELMTAEVMASCANKRDRNAFISLVDSLYGWSTGAALADAIRQGHKEWYKDMILEIKPGPMTESVVEALFRKYAFDLRTLQEILHAYSAEPLITAMDAIENNYGLAEGLALPEVHDWGYGTTASYVPSLLLDDFKYFVSHTEEMAKDLFKDG